MSILARTVEQALKDKAPKLHASLAASGELKRFAQDTADEISSATVDSVMEQRLREKWDDLGPMECAAKMRTAAALHREVALAEALEFPPDETSSPSPG
jgi:hypothetical protein